MSKPLLGFLASVTATASSLGSAQSPDTLSSVDWPEPPPGNVQLITYPLNVYFTTANPKQRIAASTFYLGVDAPSGTTFEPGDLTIEYRQDGTVIRTDRLDTSVLKAESSDAGLVYPPAIAATRELPYAIRLLLTEPSDMPFDSVRVTLDARIDGQPRALALTIPVMRYEQKTKLIFPFRGPGIVTAGSAISGGHQNRSGLYAIDALGLSGTYGPLLTDEEDGDPGIYSGWGREIVAPAAGTVVFARNDHIGQPVAGISDPAYFSPQYRNGGDPGNYVVIDHGNSEFSMIAHMQEGSIRVAPGNEVRRGQVLGLLGNSGDTSGPHVHYQLQNGPDWERSDALPIVFENVPWLVPGSYFDAE